MKTIYLIRHPETMAGEGVCYGQTDVDVAPEVMTKALAKVRTKLGDFIPDVIYSSPLQRCYKLAQGLQGDLPIVKDERLKEIHFGRWEMQPWKAIPKEELEVWGDDFLTSHLNGGESYGDLQVRFSDFWHMLTAGSHQGALVFTHSGIIKAFLAQSLEASVSKVFSLQVDYADVIKVVWHHDNYQEITFV